MDTDHNIELLPPDEIPFSLIADPLDYCLTPEGEARLHAESDAILRRQQPELFDPCDPEGRLT